MTKRKKYLYSDTDRNGNQRTYFKPPGQRKQRLKHALGTPEANEEYKRMMKAYEAGKDYVETGQFPKGSTAWLLMQFMASAEYKSKSDGTKLQRSNFYTRYIRIHGLIPYADLTSKDLAKVVEQLGPGAARNFLKAMTAAFKWACRPEVGLADSNPAVGVTRPSAKTLGYVKWTIEDVVQFKNFYDQGSNPRKCLAMLLFTGREISGVRTLGRGDVREGMIRGHRQKTWVDATTPMLPILKEELGDDYNDLVWLRASHGGPYSVKSLSQTFSGWATDAGLPELSAHGLRKSVGTILADLGMSENTIMAALSHSDPRQAQTYVQNANNKKLAIEGMQLVEAKVAHFWRSGKVGN